MSSKSEIKQVLANKGLRNIGCVYSDNSKAVYVNNLKYDKNIDSLYDADRSVAIPYDLIAGLRTKDKHKVEYSNENVVKACKIKGVGVNIETLFSIVTIKNKIDQTLRSALNKNEISINELSYTNTYNNVDCVYYDEATEKLLKKKLITISDLGIKVKIKEGKYNSVSLEDIQGLCNSHTGKLIYENEFFLHNDLELEPEKSRMEKMVDYLKNTFNQLQNIAQQFFFKKEESVAEQTHEQVQTQEQIINFVSPKKSAAELIAEGKKERDKVEKELELELGKTVQAEMGR